jgi:fructokinase
MTNPIVGVGELVWDVFPDGRTVAGGAPFNFAFHCRQLGHDAVIVSRVGDDEPGRRLRAEVRRLGLTDAYIQTDPVRPTGTVQVSVDHAGVPSYEIRQGVAWDFIEWTPELDALTDRAAVVCHGMLALRSPASRATVERMIEENRKSILPSVRVLDVNLREPRPGKAELDQALTAAEWVKVNGDELDELAGLFRLTPAGLMQAHRDHAAGHECVWLVTHGSAGAEVYAPAGHYRQPAPPARVVDTVGAGDAFTAAAVCLHLDGKPWDECLRFAVRYAAAVCEHPGATPRIDQPRLRDDRVSG